MPHSRPDSCVPRPPNRLNHRFLSRLIQVVVSLALLAPVPAALAQTGAAPRFVEFTVSADHNVLLADGRAAVTAYRLEFLLSGAAQPFQAADIGKPAPDGTGKVTRDLSTTSIAWPVAGAAYKCASRRSAPTAKGAAPPPRRSSSARRPRP